LVCILKKLAFTNKFEGSDKLYDMKYS